MKVSSQFKSLIAAMLLLTLVISFGQAQHTFSIVAVDPETGEVGCAGATCLNEEDCNGCGGAVVIGGLLPGRGAICSQATVCIPNGNLLDGIGYMQNGGSPSGILLSLELNDACGFGDFSNRQYGIVDLDENNEPRTAAHTGSAAESYADHIIGDNYTVQGNILIGPEVLEGMQEGFENTEGSLAEKLMAAMQGANIPGADSRCLAEGTSSRSSFLMVACPPDNAPTDCRDINIVIPQLETGEEPIDALQERFDEVTSANFIAFNDICSNAAFVAVQQASDSCDPSTADLDSAMSSSLPISDCTYTQSLSDVWYTFNLGANVPGNLTIDALYDPQQNTNDLGLLGCALYTSCGPLALPLFCTTLDPNEPVLLPVSCLEPDRDYFLKFWDDSRGEAGSQFSFCLHTEDTQGANTILWGDAPGEGTFDEGFGDWTTNGISDEDHVWVWEEAGNFQGGLTNPSLNSLSRCNGSVGFMADFYATGGDPNNVPSQPYPIFTGDLVSPVIDLSEAVLPILQFSQFFAGLNGGSIFGANTDVGALLAWSDDGGSSWSTPVPINDDDYDSNDFSPNPVTKQVALTELGGVSQARFKFIFHGDFYFWLIDDVLLLENGVMNTAIDPAYYVIPDNYLTPFHQISPVPVGGRVHNYGGLEATNLRFNTSIDWVNESGATVSGIYTNTADLSLDPGTEDFYSMDLAECFEPQDHMKGDYALRYELLQEEEDSEPINNTAESNFKITDNVLSKGPVNADGTPVHDTFWGPIEPGPYEYGVHFYIPNEGSIADSVMLACAAPAGAVLEGTEIEVYLYKWDNTEPLNAIDTEELTIVGFAAHDFTDEANEEFFTLRLYGNPVLTQGIALEPGHYILTMNYEGDDNLYMNANSTIDYSASIENSFIQANAQEDANLFRFADIVRLGDNWLTGGFDGPGVPAMNIYLNTEVPASIDQPRALPVTFTNTPEGVQVKLGQVEEPVEMLVLDINGRTQKAQSIPASSTSVYIDMSSMPRGTYLICLQTKSGKKAIQKFVKL